MTTYLSIPEAAKKLDIPVKRLKAFVADGVIQTMRYKNLDLVNLEEVEDALPREYRPEYQELSHLAGQPIHVSAAARKYNLKHQTISNWVKSGYIKILFIDGKFKHIDEQDVAYCAMVYQEQGGGRGRWIMRQTF